MFKLRKNKNNKSNNDTNKEKNTYYRNNYQQLLSAEDICVICGDYCPEGTQVCPACQKKYS